MHAASHGGRQILRHIARIAMIERGLQPEFSPAALRQTAAFAGPALVEKNVRDLRALPWVSIDNDDSRDLDQISAAAALPAGATRIWVAIADVDALVGAGTPIDVHAHRNTTSVYTPAQIFPMLPERLSTELTSLNDQQERLALVVEMDISSDGEVTVSNVYRAQVRNQAKLAYPSVSEWLEGRAPPPPGLTDAHLQTALRLQDAAAQKLRAKRHIHGALTLETLKTHAVFDGDALRDLEPEHKNRGQELIEDLMIAANGAVACFLDQHGAPSLRRVLRTPRRWERIVALAAGVGEHLPGAPDALALNQFLCQRRQIDPERFADLSLAVIKSLGSGEYLAQQPGKSATGHFGLAVSNYTHSSAPNRRFPDLISQRLVKAVLAGKPSPYPFGLLEQLAEHCTQQEDNAAKVERRVAKSAAALLLAGRLGEVFDALVTGAAPKGTWVRILRPAVEGRLLRGFEDADIGQRMRVRLVRVEVERGFIDFERVH
jgi:VacB/RNase II family 3'-5' exoribonuclease